MKRKPLNHAVVDSIVKYAVGSCAVDNVNYVTELCLVESGVKCAIESCVVDSLK